MPRRTSQPPQSASPASPALDGRSAFDALDLPESAGKRGERGKRGKRPEVTAPPTPDLRSPAGAGRVPTYRIHRPSGRAVVTVAGKDHYLGIFGSAASRDAYDRVVAEWLSRGRPSRVVEPGDGLTVAAVVLAYWRFVKQSYSRPTSSGTVAPTLRRLRRLYGTEEAAKFGPRCLRALQEALVQEVDKHGRRLSRRYINRSVGWVKRCFKWAVAEELIEPSILQALQAVEPLRMGRTGAPELRPIGPVADAVIGATLPHLQPLIADMVRVQRLTGMRPGELCAMRTVDLDMSGDVWLYSPWSHKTAHHGKSRSIPIGPQAQRILAVYVRRETAAYIFSPAESETRRYEAIRAARKTPMTPSQRERNRAHAKNRLSRLGDRYTTQSYALAIWRACDKAGIDRWSPNRLRHTRATELRKQFGLDAASAVLGHAKVETTQIYAERSMDIAVRAAQATG